MAHPEPPYWVVWQENGDRPTYRHPTPDLAENEALRLARQMPGKTFVVLAPVARVTVGIETVERFDPDSYIPF
jgi:hypothetical protein